MKTAYLSVNTMVGRWTLLSRGISGKHAVWNCRCACGLVKNVYASHLASGKSNGCLKCAIETHGMTKSPTWTSWSAMRNRCDNQSHKKYHLYGGRGISYPSEWQSFEKFLEDVGTRPNGTTLERIKSDESYSKGNCKWATIVEQNNNRSNNTYIEYNGEQYTCANLARHLGISYCALLGRIKNGKQIDAPYTKRKSPSK